ncbi:glutamine--tRNA ligase/YqeY domain fusion protein [Vallitalea okinawensis]|uniref:glutamine--tRNA ligase/YqeY domain fusion protein n=1 Tax=Vallitalea okinawensis TaxID=2078660 RepID=UPI000CFAF4D9|nr:glutamine--tRNA ligase/YqeY domain fusion protein [Vallitalea okinawensis]
MDEAKNFIEEIIEKDLEEDVYGQRVHTRFPPEPNGYLHIGHAKAICTDFGMAKKYNGKCNLRFDDTNPIKEDTEYVESIMEDVKWLGFQWDELHYASNYFDKLYECAVELIKKGKAYVCDLSAEEMREYRGTLTEPGKNSPYRDRSVEENLDIFERMSKGEFADGEKVLRAKIDMASPNITMRDPVMYRIAHVHHHKAGDKWCIYPMYDFAHPISDAIEGITHSICTLEFEDHRPLYDWFLEQLEWKEAPKQIEFSRLELTNIVTSKRKLLKLVQDGIVDGWSDPRMPTIAGLRRRGVTPDALRTFCYETPLTKNKGVVEFAFLEHLIREDMKLTQPRIMGVLDPLKVVITNYPEGEVEYLEAENNQEVPEMGKRQIPFGREIYIERDDFMEEPPKKFFRLAPGKEVRLKHAYFIKCEEVIKDENGEVIELRCTYDPETKSGTGFTGRKVKGTLHWVSATESVDVSVRLYDHLFNEDEESGESILNENSVEVLEGCKIEASIKDAEPGSRYQFFRHGYFIIDTEDTKDGNIVFNRIVSLKSSYKPPKK